MSNFIFVYGTLREGDYNFRRFKAIYPEIKVVEKNVVVDDYTLISLSDYYPMAIPKKNGNVVGEILKVSKEAFQNISKMELSAGYKIVNVKTKNYDDLVMFVGPDLNVNGKHTFNDWYHYKKNLTHG